MNDLDSRSSTKSEPDLSVLTPSYGYGRYIRNAVDSVVASGSLRVEHIIQDACSEDETKEVLIQAERRLNHPLKWSMEPDTGQSDALNKALSKAKGKWIGWLNADEFYLPHGLEELVSVGEKTGADVVYGDAVFVDGDGHLIRLKPQHPFNQFVLKNYGVFISTCATIFRRSALWPQPWDTHLQLLMDHDLYMKLAHRSARFLYVPYPVASFRVHPDRVSAQTGGFGPDYAIVEGRHGRGGLFSKGAAWALHAAYKAASGGYKRQSRAKAFEGAPMTWIDSPDHAEQVRRFLHRCYNRSVRPLE